MRIAVSHFFNEILEVERTPATGSASVANGRYYVPVPEGVRIELTTSVVPTSNPNSVVYRAYNGLLQLFPQFSQVVFNPLIEPAHILELDPTGFLNEGAPVQATHVARFQAGRGAGPLALGNAPNSVALLPVNNTLGPGNDRPGVLVTNTVDIGLLTGGQGATEFGVFWYTYDFTTGVDVHAQVGAFAGQNAPALRMISESEPPDVTGWLSGDNGSTFLQVDNLGSIAFCDPVKELKFALKSTSSTKRYVAGYALLF